MHPLAAPGTLWVLSRVGKYLVRPQADETSHKKQISCRRQEKGLPFFLPYHKGFRLCGGDQGAFRSPPGPLRGPSLYEWEKHPTRNKILAEGRKRAYLSFPASQRLSPLRRRPGGFPIAPWTPSGGLFLANQRGVLQKMDFVEGKGKGALLQRVEKVADATFSRKQIRSTRGRPNL